MNVSDDDIDNWIALRYDINYDPGDNPAEALLWQHIRLAARLILETEDESNEDLDLQGAIASGAIFRWILAHYGFANGRQLWVEVRRYRRQNPDNIANGALQALSDISQGERTDDSPALLIQLAGLLLVCGIITDAN